MPVRGSPSQIGYCTAALLGKEFAVRGSPSHVGYCTAAFCVGAPNEVLVHVFLLFVGSSVVM